MDEFEEQLGDEELHDLLQFSGNDVSAIERILKNDVRERTESGEPNVQADPAYLLGAVSMAFNMVSPEKHTFDEDKLRQRRMLHECGLDILRMKAAWLERYPELREAMENSRRKYPVIKGGKSG